MKAKRPRTLVLMRCTEEEERTLFAGDLYAGHSFEGSVYYDRAAMLQWLAPIDAQALSVAAQAMNELLAYPDMPMRLVQVSAPAVF